MPENLPYNDTKSGGKVIIIGLDSAEPSLVENWISNGNLPFMQSLKERGVWARIESTADWLSDTPWPTFHTGVNPGKHGYYTFLPINRGTTSITRINARHCQYLPFWAELRGSDKKVAIFDVPKTYPLEGINGIQLSAWGEEYPLMPTSSLPETFKDELIRKFGSYQHITELPNPIRVEPEKRIYNTLMKNIKIKSRAIQALLKQDDWDFFMATFGECHYANHQFFHHFNAKHWGHNPKKSEQLGNSLLNIYRELDSALAEILSNVPDDATVIVLSVHGIKPNYGGNHLMSSLLEKLDFQAKATSEETQTESFDLKSLSRLTKKIIPDKLREYINERFVPNSIHDEMASWEFNRRIDWHKSRAFFMPNSIFQSFISINLKGREPFGVVEPGEEYENLCCEIREELRKLVNPETGKSAVKDIAITSHIFPGENINNLPDLILQWAEDEPIEKLWHPEVGVVAEPIPALRKTQHAGEGFMIAAGKRVKCATHISKAHILDLAPTILGLLEKQPLAYMEGSPLTDLFHLRTAVEKHIKTRV